MFLLQHGLVVSLKSGPFRLLLIIVVYEIVLSLPFNFIDIDFFVLSFFDDHPFVLIVFFLLVKFDVLQRQSFERFVCNSL